MGLMLRLFFATSKCTWGR